MFRAETSLSGRAGKARFGGAVDKIMETRRIAASRWEKVAHLLLILLGVGTAVTLASRGGGAWERGLAMGLGLGALLAIVAAWRGWIALRQAVAAALLCTGAGFLFAWLAGFWPFAYGALHDVRHVSFVAGVTTVAALGVLFRTIWGRWMALALGLGAIFSGGLNALYFLFFYPGCAWERAHDAAAPTFMLFTLWGGALVVSLSGATISQAFLARSRNASLWGSSDRLVRVVRWTILANLVAVPMLLVYGWLQPVVAATSTSAFVLAGVLGLGSLLAMARKVVGAVLLCLGGVGLLVQTLMTLWLGGRALVGITSYYSVFWIPAALASCLCAVVLAGPLMRLLRR